MNRYILCTDWLFRAVFMNDNMRRLPLCAAFFFSFSYSAINQNKKDYSEFICCIGTVGFRLQSISNSCYLFMPKFLQSFLFYLLRFLFCFDCTPRSRECVIHIKNYTKNTRIPIYFSISFKFQALTQTHALQL